MDQLRYHAVKRNDLLKSITANFSVDHRFTEYESAWPYYTAVKYSESKSVDILARLESPGDYSIIGEVKNRTDRKFSKNETVVFLDKFKIIRGTET